jgi:hypothetical protein
MASSTEIVDEMIARLRELQGSGEYPPLARKIEAGPGLAGGGTLENDVRLDLAVEHRELLGALAEIGAGEIFTRADAANLVTADQLAAAAKPRVFYRDFTVGQAPLQAVTSPPVRVDETAVITRISVSVGTPGSQPVDVTVAGETVRVNAGVESATKTVKINRAAGNTVAVTVGATSASGIVVSLRFEEA